jgi:hypothetical protein
MLVSRTQILKKISHLSKDTESEGLFQIFEVFSEYLNIDECKVLVALGELWFRYICIFFVRNVN